MKFLSFAGPATGALSIPNLSQESGKRVSLSSSGIEKSLNEGQVEKLTTDKKNAPSRSQVSYPSLRDALESISRSQVSSPRSQVSSPKSQLSSPSQVSSPSHRDALGSISNCQDELGEIEVFVSKMQRSTASYGIKDLLREQVLYRKTKLIILS